MRDFCATLASRRYVVLENRGADNGCRMYIVDSANELSPTPTFVFRCVRLILYDIVRNTRRAGPRKQVQADPRCVRMKDHNRDALLDQLVERALDVSPFVR